MKDHVTFREIGQHTGLSQTTIRRWCDKGMLECYRLPMSNHRRVLTTVFQAFLAKNDMPPYPPGSFHARPQESPGAAPEQQCPPPQRYEAEVAIRTVLKTKLKAPIEDAPIHHHRVKKQPLRIVYGVPVYESDLLDVACPLEEVLLARVDRILNGQEAKEVEAATALLPPEQQPPSKQLKTGWWLLRQEGPHYTPPRAIADFLPGCETYEQALPAAKKILAEHLESEEHSDDVLEVAMLVFVSTALPFDVDEMRTRIEAEAAADKARKDREAKERQFEKLKQELGK